MASQKAISKRDLNTGRGENDTVFKGHSTQDTFLTFDSGKTLLKQADANEHAEDVVLRGYDECATLIDENGIWLNNSPCSRCAKLIMRTYSDVEPMAKPTIYIQNVYVKQGLNSTLDSLMCLAKMLSEGFNIVPWDWKEFKIKLTNRENTRKNNCVHLIDEATRNEKFKL